MSAWTQTHLGNEIELAYGKALPSQVRRAGEFAVFGSNGVVGTHDEPLVDGPGIIVGRKGSVGAVAYSQAPFWPIDTTYYVVNKGGHDWRFLHYLLLSLGLTELNSHSAVPGLNREDAYSISIQMPPMDVQKTIARMLDDIQTVIRCDVDALTSARALKRAISERLLLGAQEAQDAGWIVERIGDSHTVSSGGTPSRSVPEYWVGGTIPWVKTTEVNYAVIAETSEHITQAGLDGSAAKIFPAGTVLLAMYGQGVTRGKVALLGIEAASNQACAAIQPSNDVVDGRFVYHFLAHQYDGLRQMAHGGQQQNLNLDIVRDYPICYPRDRDAQAQVIEVFEALDEKIHLHESRLPLLEALFDMLLSRLMSGQVDEAVLHEQSELASTTDAGTAA